MGDLRTTMVSDNKITNYHISDTQNFLIGDINQPLVQKMMFTRHKNVYRYSFVSMFFGCIRAWKCLDALIHL